LIVSKPKKKKSKKSPESQFQKKYSPLGWIILLGPISIIAFLLLFGDSIPFLNRQSASEAKTQAESLVGTGKTYLHNGDYQNAYGYFMRAISVKQDFTEAYIFISQIYYLNDKITTAIDWLQKALAFNPPEKDLVLNNLGLLYAKKGEFIKAREMFEQALTVGMNTEMVYNNLGSVSLSLGDYAKAVEYYRFAVDSRPTVKSLYIESLRRAYIEYYHDEEDGYISVAAKKELSTEINEDDLARYDADIIEQFGRSKEREGELYSNLARALEMNGEIDEAFKNAAIALNYAPNSYEVQYRLGNLYLRKGMLEDAQRYINKSLKLNPNYEPARTAMQRISSIIGESIPGGEKKNK